ncbi:MAG TPA: VIT domain-containing protein, partial [Tepidisphaeraceae bacterium]
MKRGIVRWSLILVVSAGLFWIIAGCTARQAVMYNQSRIDDLTSEGISPTENSRIQATVMRERSPELEERSKVPSQVLDAKQRNAILESVGGNAEELWVISKPPENRDAPKSDQPMPGEGQLMAKRLEGGAQKLIPVPLKHTDVKASVMGYIASVDVQQQYQNPYNEKIEAIYVFPLPQNAAVNEFVMTVGERKIRGIIREREEAQKIYQEAKSQGYVASLLTQERPNVFTQAVANIEPGRQIDIDIRYFNTLDYRDGAYEFVFPMVVGPRFNPPGYYGGIGAVARGGQGSSRQQTEVKYLAPNERSGHDIALTVDVDPGVEVEHIDSRNHHVSAQRVSGTKTRITLDPADKIPNRDFVLRYEVAGKQVKPAIMAQRSGNGGYFSLMLFPPGQLTELPRQPLEFVFTIDVSGSQDGLPLEQEKAATRYALTHMGPQDTFQVIRFGNTARKLFELPQPADPAHVRQALRYVDGLDAHEGTMLIDGVHASLLFPHDPSRTRYVAFLTDGFIGNDTEAIAEVGKCLGPARLFSFGVGQSTNRYLLDGLARMGRGAVAYVGLHDSADKIMGQYFDRISHPALSDISIDWEQARVHDVFPRQVPDLYVGRPVVISGRFEGEVPKSMRIRGTVGGREVVMNVPVVVSETVVNEKALPAVWARMKIADLADQAGLEGGIDLPGQVRQIAMEYNLMSAYTAFVAVDSMTKTLGDHGVSVAVPVPVPEGVR